MRTAWDEARRANDAKTEFLAAVSHDLRQPVQAAMLFIDVLKRMELPESVRRPVDMIAGSARVLREMLDDLLDLARLNAGIVRPRVKPFRIDRLIADLADEFRPQAAAANLVLELAVDPAGVCSDPILLSQILRNLIGNAIKYTPEGAVVITGERRGDRVAITVADTGIGIDEQMVDHIYDDFFQVANPNRDRSRGLGIGLSTVRRIAGLLGHEISVWSKVGSGSEFTITVPWAEADVVIEEARESPLAGDTVLARRSLAGRRVLLVEDEAPVAAAMANIMEDWGILLTSAASLAELEQMLPSMEPPDVLITDYRLPEGQTGGEVVAAVKRRWEVPAIIITGDTAEYRLQAARNLGHPLLHKPISGRELLLALAQHL